MRDTIQKVTKYTLAEHRRNRVQNIAPLSEEAGSRIVLDTDCLVGAAYAEGSASRRVLEMCLRGEVVALVSRDLQHEYEYILGRAVRGRDFRRTLQQFLVRAEQVQPSETPRVVPEDPADDKLVAAALAGRADAIVTNDRHLLGLDPYGELRIVRPTEFVRLWMKR